jgi:hypothetical protein
MHECWWDSWLLDVAICNSLGEPPAQVFNAARQPANKPASQFWYSQNVMTVCYGIIAQ